MIAIATPAQEINQAVRAQYSKTHCSQCREFCPSGVLESGKCPSCEGRPIEPINKAGFLHAYHQMNTGRISFSEWCHVEREYLAKGYSVSQLQDLLEGRDNPLNATEVEQDLGGAR